MAELVLERRSTAPTALLISKSVDMRWELHAGDSWIGTPYWVVSKERFIALPRSVRSIEGRSHRTAARAIDAAVEKVLARALRKPQPVELGELVAHNSIACHRISLVDGGTFLPDVLNANVAAVLAKVTPDCRWLWDGTGAVVRVDGTVPWAVAMLMRVKS